MQTQESYPTREIRQAPTLGQLKIEQAWKRAQRDALRRQIWASQAFVDDHRPPAAIARRIAQAVASNLLQLADVVDDLDSIGREIDRLETALFGWRHASVEPRS